MRKYSYARKVRINQCGYDADGKYWGFGPPLYEVTILHRMWFYDPWEEYVLRVRAYARWDAFGVACGTLSKSQGRHPEILAPLYAPNRN